MGGYNDIDYAEHDGLEAAEQLVVALSSRMEVIKDRMRECESEH